MTIRLSTGLRNHMLSGGSWRSAFSGGKLEVYTGSQPASADTAPSGTKILTYTASSGAHTEEVQPTGTAVLAGVAGTVTNLKVDGEDLQKIVTGPALGAMLKHLLEQVIEHPELNTREQLLQLADGLRPTA